MNTAKFTKILVPYALLTIAGTGCGTGMQLSPASGQSATAQSAQTSTAATSQTSTDSNTQAATTYQAIIVPSNNGTTQSIYIGSNQTPTCDSNVLAANSSLVRIDLAEDGTAATPVANGNYTVNSLGFKAQSLPTAAVVELTLDSNCQTGENTGQSGTVALQSLSSTGATGTLDIAFNGNMRMVGGFTATVCDSVQFGRSNSVALGGEQPILATCEPSDANTTTNYTAIIVPSDNGTTQSLYIGSNQTPTCDSNVLAANTSLVRIDLAEDETAATPVASGSYTVNNIGFKGQSVPTAAVVELTLDSNCQTGGNTGQTGSVTLSTLSSTGATGSLDIGFNGNVHMAGSFTATMCESVQFGRSNSVALGGEQPILATCQP